jgi:hypothetical protein
MSKEEQEVTLCLLLCLYDCLYKQAKGKRGNLHIFVESSSYYVCGHFLCFGTGWEKQDQTPLCKSK